MLYDVSGNGKNGVLQNNPGWVAGRGGWSMTFDGSTQYVSNTISSGMSGNFTITGWIYPTAAPTGQVVVASEVASYSNYWISLGTYSNVWGFALYDGTNNPHAISSSSATNVWMMWTGVRSSGTLYFYINAAQVGTATDTISSVPGYSAFNIGAQINKAGRYFPGKIDNIRVYSRALSADEVRLLYMRTGG